MKALKRIIAAVFLVALMAGIMPPVAVNASEDLTVITNINKTMEIPLTLDASTDEFYVNGNINPGDVMTADIVFKNVSDSSIQVRISDVTDQLQTTMSQKLLEILDLSIEIDGSPVYKGKHDKVTNPLTQWIELGPNEDMTMKLRIEFSKYEADNTYQGAEMKVKYVFEARADVPLDSTLNKNSEKIKTGVDDVYSVNPASIILISSAAVVVFGFAVYVIISRKKKDKNTQTK